MTVGRLLTYENACFNISETKFKGKLVKHLNYLNNLLYLNILFTSYDIIHYNEISYSNPKVCSFLIEIIKKSISIFS